MDQNIFNLLETIVGGGDSPATWMSELVAEDAAAVPSAVAAGYVSVLETDLAEDGPLVELTAKGLRAFCAARGESTDEEIEETIKQYNLK